MNGSSDFNSDIDYAQDSESPILDPYYREYFDYGVLEPKSDTDEPHVEIIIDPTIHRTLDASNFLKGILLRMGLSGQIAATVRHGTIYLEILGAEPGLIIGHRGQNLDALQHLVNRMVNKNADDMTPITVDSDDYRSRRHQQLERSVKIIGKQVMGSGKAIITDPMTPSERRLFHIAASRIRGIKTASFGNGFFQPIKVSPANTRNRYQNDPLDTNDDDDVFSSHFTHFMDDDIEGTPFDSYSQHDR